MKYRARRLLVYIISALTLLTPATARGQKAQRLLHVYNWSDYIDKNLLSQFTAETGIKVVYDTYDSNEKLEAKLLAGKSGYDLVFPSATFLQRHIQAGIYRKMDRSRLKYSSGIWKEIDQQLRVYDPGNQYAINYMWFTTGIAFDKNKIRQRNGGNQIDSWNQVLRPDELKKYADCGVYFLDSPEDMFSIALKYLKFDPDSEKRGEIRKAALLLRSLQPHVRKFHSSEYINALAGGDICLAIGWAGDSFQARNRAREAKNGVEIEYVIPKEGTLISMDNFAIPKDARNVAEAYTFIDFMLRPEIAARNTMTTNFANGVSASHPYVESSVLSNKSVYPDPAGMKALFSVKPRRPTSQRLITREWTRVKTGR